MKRKRFLAVACAAAMIASMTTGLAVNVSAADEKSDFAGEELSILVSAGWMDNRYDETIKRFEDTYDVTVDLQTIPADQYSDLLQSKLATDSLAWEMSLGVAPAVTRPATKKRRLDESKSGDDGAGVSTSDCFFKEGA